MYVESRSRSEDHDAALSRTWLEITRINKQALRRTGYIVIDLETQDVKTTTRFLPRQHFLVLTCASRWREMMFGRCKLLEGRPNEESPGEKSKLAASIGSSIQSTLRATMMGDTVVLKVVLQKVQL